MSITFVYRNTVKPTSEPTAACGGARTDWKNGGTENGGTENGVYEDPFPR